MSAASVVPAGHGEVIGDAPDRRVEILCEHDAVHVTWTRFGPGRDGASPHIHRRHIDLFYVLEGELTVRLGPAGEEEVAVPAGTLVRVPPLVVHGFRNAGDAELRYLNLHAPGRGFVGYMRALRDGRTPVFDQDDPPVDGGRAGTEAVIGPADVEVAEIAVREVSLEPGAAGPPPRSQADGGGLDAFYVLDGELALTAGERDVRAPAGAWVQVTDALTVSVTAAGRAPVRYLHVRAPGQS